MLITTEQWLGVENSETLEKRTYESGQVRWYHKGFYRWYRLEQSMAYYWLKKKYFVKPDELQVIKEKESIKMMHRYWLHLAQKVGSNK